VPEPRQAPPTVRERGKMRPIDTFTKRMADLAEPEPETRPAADRPEHAGRARGLRPSEHFTRPLSEDPPHPSKEHPPCRPARSRHRRSANRLAGLCRLRRVDAEEADALAVDLNRVAIGDE